MPKRKAAELEEEGEQKSRKRGAEEDLRKYRPLDFFVYYTRQVTLKHAGKSSAIHPFVRDFGFPPASIQDEIVLRFVKEYLLRKVAKRDDDLGFLLVGALQAPDQPWCFKEMLPLLLRGLRAHRRDGYRSLLLAGAKRKPTSPVWERLEAALQRRYVRGIDPELLRSGKRKGHVQGYGDVGLYHAEHQTSIMPGLTHPQGLRWKLEHWPAWLELAALRQIKAWPDADDGAAIDALLARPPFARQFPEGVRTRLEIGPGRSRRIVGLFGGDAARARSVVSQALLFADLLRPHDKEFRRLRRTQGLGVGCFTVRGFWMAYQRDRRFPALDTRTFCPGFTGALKGAENTKLRQATGVELSTAAGGSINWNSWQVQVRFAAWLWALQQHVEAARRAEPSLGRLLARAGAEPPLHCTELEATLCFSSRLATMFSVPRDSRAFYSAAFAIGDNMPESELRKLLW